MMSKDLSDVLISGESEDYTIDDIITIGGVNPKPIIAKVPVNMHIAKVENKATEEVKTETVNADLDNVEETMKDLIEKLSSTVSPNINKFVSMTKCEENLKQLYSKLETLSKSRGSAKDIIETGSEIQTFEDEKQAQNISDNDISQTIEQIRNAISVLGKFKNILEENKSNK